MAKHLDGSGDRERTAFVRFLATYRPGTEEAASWSRVLRISPAVADALVALDAARAEGLARLEHLPVGLAEVVRELTDELIAPVALVRPLALPVQAGDWQASA